MTRLNRPVDSLPPKKSLVLKKSLRLKPQAFTIPKWVLPRSFFKCKVFQSINKIDMIKFMDYDSLKIDLSILRHLDKIFALKEFLRLESHSPKTQNQNHK